jgi:hypothetical protein
MTREEMYAYLRENHSDERKADQTDDQFYYKTRKRAIGPFKKELWNVSPKKRLVIEEAWEKQFMSLFEKLNISGTKDEVMQFTHALPIHEPLSSYLMEAQVEEDVRDLAD